MKNIFIDLLTALLALVANVGAAAELAITKLLQIQAEATLERINGLFSGKPKPFKDRELTYSATVRCSCGAGLAYPKHSGAFGSWFCSDFLKMTFDKLSSQKHSSYHFHFSDYKITSENAYSAHGATTRTKITTTK